MTTSHVCRSARLLPALVLGAVVVAGATDVRFYPDDPIARVVDSQDASAVKEREIDLVYDTLENSFWRPGDPTLNVRAQSVNTIDEVPDSAWFTNRLGTRPMTAEELVQGPNRDEGPAPGTLTVVAAKDDGYMPGFRVRDSRGQLWFVKFDPPGYPAMATGTEVVVTKLFWALGYHVPEVHIATLRPDELAIHESARITTANGNRRPLKRGDISAVLRKAHRNADGSYRMFASKALTGRPVGPFRFFGVRSDDPNDVVPHEHRRELRAYGVFSAWVNHVDSKSINTLDTVIEQDGAKVVRHHLLDFGSTIGSAGVQSREAFEGWEHLIEGRSTLIGMPTFGFYLKPWRTLPMYRAPAVGGFPLDHAQWDPEQWKPRYPNAAFRASRLDDKFWAARRLQAFSDEMLRAIVRVGQFNDPESEQMVARFLIDRRDAIVRRYLPAVNPIVDPRLGETGALTFHNAAVEADLSAAPAEYVVRWRRFDNLTRATTELGSTRAPVPRLDAPPNLPWMDGSYILAEISAWGGPESWSEPAHAYFRRKGSAWQLVGFERLPGGNSPRAMSAAQSPIGAPAASIR
jgi:hypothetical protein